MIKRMLAMAAAVILLLVLLPGYADFGDFSGDSDYGGGSDWSSSSDSDWDYSGGGSGGSGDSDTDWLLLGAAILGSVLVLARPKNSRSGSSSGTRTANKPTWGFQLKEAGQCPVPLPDAARVGSLYRRMQDAWGAGDLTPLRSEFTADCYAQYSRQLKGKMARNEHPHCDVYSVESAVRGWNEDDQEYMAAVEVTAVITAWNEDGDGKVISGSKFSKKEMRYAWVLRKSKDAAAGAVCPNCGNPVDINEGAFCPSCGAALTASGSDWALSSIQGISQKTL